MSNRKTVPLTVSLPRDQLKMVKSLVASGSYASDSEVVCAGLRLLRARDEAMERWLREEVLPAYRQLKEDPSSGMSVEQVRATLSRRRHRSLSD